jgi:hypothetical protein
VDILVGQPLEATDCTASVLEIFFDCRRDRSSMLRKSVFPPVLSW